MLIAGVLTVLATGWGSAAFAHALLVSTDPGAGTVVARGPDQVTLTFNEPVEILFGAVRVFDANGRRVDDGEAAHPEGRSDSVRVPLRQGLPDGTYTVTWRVISADSHPAAQAFVFHVGAPGPPGESLGSLISAQPGASVTAGVLLGVIRWATFVGLLLLAGGALFLPVVWRSKPALVLLPPPVEAAFLTRWWRILVWSWVLVAVATVASLPLQGAVAGGFPLLQALSPRVVSQVLGTRFGRVAAFRLILLAILGAAAAVTPLRGRIRAETATPVSVGAAGLRPSPSPALLGVGALVLLALLATPGLAGHAGTTPPLLLNIPADLLHVLAASAWLGGLGFLLGAAEPATSGLPVAERSRALAPVVSRFSTLALAAVAALVVTGSLRGWTEIRALRGLTSTPYGLTLLVKLGVFVPLLALGAVNWRWTRPRLRRLAEDPVLPPRPLHVLRRVVAGEVALGVIVLAVTALLIALPPARVSAGVQGPYQARTQIGRHTLDLLVDPNRVGENLVHLTLSDARGLPADVDRLEVRFRMPAEDIGPLVAEAKQLGPGHYVVQGHELSVPGTWNLEILADIDRFTEESVELPVVVNR